MPIRSFFRAKDTEDVPDHVRPSTTPTTTSEHKRDPSPPPRSNRQSFLNAIKRTVDKFSSTVRSRPTVRSLLSPTSHLTPSRPPPPSLPPMPPLLPIPLPPTNPIAQQHQPPLPPSHPPQNSPAAHAPPPALPASVAATPSPRPPTIRQNPSKSSSPLSPIPISDAFSQAHPSFRLLPLRTVSYRLRFHTPMVCRKV